MNIEELQDAIRSEEMLHRSSTHEIVVEAARLVANPNIEATARLLADHRGVDWADTTYMDACRRMAEQYVAAALTPPGDTK